jgi:nucleotide-binding universal stress UspA family protein
VTVVLGLPRDERDHATLRLAVSLARTWGEDLVVCAVVPRPWLPGPAKVDAEWQTYVADYAQGALDRARGLVPADITAAYQVVPARSTSSGLIEHAERHAASVLVIGSSGSGPLGRVSLGGVADRVLHSSPVPVALVPRGYRCGPAAVVDRVTAAYGATPDADDLVIGAAGLAARAGVAFRVASFAVRPGPVLTAGVGLRVEESIAAEWSREVEAAQEAVLARVAALPDPPADRGTAIGHGGDWREALEDIGWRDSDLLIVGSSGAGQIARVFLGSRASKIVRNSPSPVVVLPRTAVDALADRAEQA